MAILYYPPLVVDRVKVKVYPKKADPEMSRKKLKMEWFAEGYNPKELLEYNDFQLAIRQAAPTFEVERLDSGAASVMHGVDTMTSTVVPGCKTRKSVIKQLGEKLLLRWKDILSGERFAGYYIVGACVQPKETRVWLYHPRATMLFILGFATKDDDWLEEPVYKFE